MVSELAPDSVEAPNADAPKAVGPDPKPEATGDTPTTPETGSEAPEGTGAVAAQEPAAEAEFDWRKEVGVEVDAKAAAPESEADRFYHEQTERAHEGRAAAYQRYVTDASQEARTYASEVLGLTGAELDEFSKKASNLIEGLHSAHNAYFAQVLTTAAGLELGDEARARFWGRRYPDWRAFFSAAFEDARNETKAEYEAQIKAGKLVKETDVEKIVIALKSKIRSSNDDGSGTSTAPQRTAAAAGARWRTKTEARGLHAKDQISNAEMRRILADPNIPD